MHRSRFFWFDYLRLALAGEVAVMHVNSLGPKLGLPWLLPMVPGFLSLSGFLVLQSWERSTPSQFWMKRVRRIIPAMLLSLVLVGLIFGASAAVNSLRIYGSLGYSIDPGAQSNGPLWSLGWEELLYFSLLPLSLLGAYSHRKWLLWGILAASIAIFVFLPANPHNRAPWAAQLPLAFCLGNLAYVYREQVKPLAQRYAWHLMLVALGLRVAEWLTVRGSGAWVPENVLVWSLTICAILALGLSKETTRKAPPDFSFGLYCFHWPILAYVTGTLGIKTAIAFPLVLVPTLALATASWFLVERPAIQWKPKAKAETVAATVAA